MQNDATRSDDATTDRVAPGPVEGSPDVNTKPTLLSTTDPQAFGVENPDGASPILFVSDHAGRAIPQHLGMLGLGEDELSRHIGYDIGIYGVTRELARTLDATYIFQPYSRLVIDCNRKPRKPQSVPEISDGTVVPGNAGLSPEARAARVAQVYAPFCDAVDRVLAARQAQGTPFALVTLHSFTPLWHGTPREVELGLLHDADSRLADAMLDHAPALPHRVLRRNAPYGPEDGVTHSLQRHGLRHGLPNALLPVLTIAGITVASLIGGALLIEVTFSWPGIALRLQEAINQRDYPVVQGIVVVIAALVVLVSVAVDLLVAALDPRIRY